MNDSELKARLQRMPAPARTEEYWEDFPARMRVRSQRQRARRLSESIQPRRARLFWVSGLAGAAIAILLIWNGGQKLERTFHYSLRKDIEQLPGNLKSFMQDEHGQHSLVADPQ